MHKIKLLQRISMVVLLFLCGCRNVPEQPETPSNTSADIKELLIPYEAGMNVQSGNAVISNLSADTYDPTVQDAYVLTSDGALPNTIYVFHTSRPEVYIDTVFPAILEAVYMTWSNTDPSWLSYIENHVVWQDEQTVLLLLGEDAFVEDIQSLLQGGTETKCVYEIYERVNLPAMLYRNQQGTNVLSRKTANAIAVYTIEDSPSVNLIEDSYEGIPYTVLEVRPNSYTTVEIVSSSAKGSNEPMYLSQLAEDERTVLGAVNGGFFNHRTTSSQYGYPTGAVRHNSAYETYTFKETGETVDTVPSYGKGFVTAWFHPYGGMEILYNGWKDGVFYKYADDPEPNSWDYTPTESYEEAISGAYSLLVNGEVCTYGINDSGYRNNNGTGTTLFGNKEDGSFVFLITSGQNRSLSFEQQLSLVQKLGWYNALRMDGGGSSQMMLNPDYLNLP